VSEDWFDAAPRELILRRALLALRLSPGCLARLGPARWTAFASRLAYWRSLRGRTTREEWRRLTGGVPVLLYHAFGDEPSRFVIPTRVFARQMRVLALLGFRVVPYGELADALRAGNRRTAVLTLDDGYADNAEIAAILERHGFGATVFVVSGRLGGVNDWSDAAPLRDRRLLSVEELVQLRARGFEPGAHTRTHPALPDLDDEAIAPEVDSSRRELEQALGAPVRFFAYPYGRADDRAVAAVRAAGFAGACTTEPRPARLGDDPLLLPRIEIKRSDSLLRFLTKVWFGGS
jgi:peptidoglycan/xylan/chitin deacetylase (PgdA/CDA1 family)